MLVGIKHWETARISGFSSIASVTKGSLVGLQYTERLFQKKISYLCFLLILCVVFGELCHITSVTTAGFFLLNSS